MRFVGGHYNHIHRNLELSWDTESKTEEFDIRPIHQELIHFLNTTGRKELAECIKIEDKKIIFRLQQFPSLFYDCIPTLVKLGIKKEDLDKVGNMIKESFEKPTLFFKNALMVSGPIDPKSAAFTDFRDPHEKKTTAPKVKPKSKAKPKSTTTREITVSCSNEHDRTFFKKEFERFFNLHQATLSGQISEFRKSITISVEKSEWDEFVELFTVFIDSIPKRDSTFDIDDIKFKLNSNNAFINLSDEFESLNISEFDLTGIAPGSEYKMPVPQTTGKKEDEYEFGLDLGEVAEPAQSTTAPAAFPAFFESSTTFSGTFFTPDSPTDKNKKSPPQQNKTKEKAMDLTSDHLTGWSAGTDLSFGAGAGAGAGASTVTESNLNLDIEPPEFQFKF